MPDRRFCRPAAAHTYDDLDADRTDLDAYLGIVDELGADSVLDLSCGTGRLAVRPASRGLAVRARRADE